MAGTVYIKMEQKTQLMKQDVTVGDLGTVFCNDVHVQSFIRTIHLYKFSGKDGTAEKPNRVVISVVQIIKKIQEKYPGYTVINLGEADMVVELVKVKKYKSTFVWIKVLFVCLVCFFGTAFTIMAFHNDIGITAVFARFYENVTGKMTSGFSVLEVSYTVGLAAGMCIFFNHIGGRRLTKDPTPIEVEMRIYEDEVNRALIATSEREGKEIDVD
ncbi:MAG: stage V sporulation protein AA [Lachnospiraceae bacterium]|nr:stage V sporulation protein AA [Lachnospiraceae bacterium]